MSCPAFGGPHLGPAADPSLIVAIPSAIDDDANKPPGFGHYDDDHAGHDDDDDDDDEDGAFGDFWRASAG